jgi:hypothetical protein
VESDAIIEYICNELAGRQLSRGANSPEYGEYHEWFAFPEGTLMPDPVVDLIYAWTGGGDEVFMDFFETGLQKTISTCRTICRSGNTCSNTDFPPRISILAEHWKYQKLGGASRLVRLADPSCMTSQSVSI